MKPPTFVHGATLVLVLGLFQPAFAVPGISKEKQAVIDQVDALEHEIENMSMELWEYSEIALTEVRSADLLAEILETEGFKLERGVAEMPTAVLTVRMNFDFVAPFGSDAIPQ